MVNTEGEPQIGIEDDEKYNPKEAEGGFAYPRYGMDHLLVLLVAEIADKEIE